jgi:hypothetical protein
MTILFEIDNFNITKKKEVIYFTIKSDLLFYFILTNYKEYIIQDSVDYTQNIFYMNNISINSLNNIMKNKNKLNYNETEKLMKDLIKQIHFFRDNNYCFEYLHPNDIIIIDKSNYILINTNILHEFSNNEFTIIKPFQKNKFMSYEQVLVRNIPCKLTFNTSYYSFGILACYLLFNKDINYSNIEEILKPIYNTSVYFCIKRCIKTKSEERKLLFI